MSASPLSSNNGPAFQALIPGQTQYCAFTNTAEYSADFSEDTTLIQLFSTQDCWVRVVLSTSSDVASVPAEATKTDSYFVPGGITAFIGLPLTKGVQYKVSVVRDSANGNLYITEGGVN